MRERKRNRIRKQERIRNTILKTYASVVFIIWLFAVLTLDSPSWTPTIVCVITTLLLGWFTYANASYFQKLDEKDGDY
jgi:hypothetical protein